MRIARRLGVILLLCAAWPVAAGAQTPGPQTTVAKQFSRPEVDAIAARLQASGVKIDRPRAVVFFEAGLLPASDQELWADLITKGIDDIEHFLRLTVPGKPEYYVATEITGTSFSFMGLNGAAPRVFLASDRVKSGAAPYLHETTHLVVLKQVSQSGNATIDREAADALAMPRGHDVLEYVGKAGSPQDLADRANVAKPFYVLAQSFTKYLIDRIGFEPFVHTLLPHLLNTQLFEADISRLSGKTLVEQKADWLQKISSKPSQP